MPVDQVQPVTRPTLPQAALKKPPAPTVSVPQQAASKAPLLNPDPVIDPRLGIVVLQYYNRDGIETNTTPSPKQLATYRQAAGQS